MGQMKTVVMVPTYCEAQNIPRLIADVFHAVPDAHLLIVDDNSPDGTAAAVRAAMPAYQGRLHLLVRTENRGRGSAGIDGFRHALALGADLVVEMDGDLSHDPAELPRLLAVAADGSADIVVGSRYVPGGRDVERGILRRAISAFARTYLRCITGVPLNDITSGYRVYRADVLRTILPELRATDPFIVTEVNVACQRHGFRFRELPIAFHERAAGESKLNAGKLVRYLFKAVRLMAGIWAQDRDLRAVALVIGASAVARIVASQIFGLTDDEAHYWQYAMHPAVSYLDHPPLVGYAIAAARAIFGDTVFAVRFPALVAGTIASVYAALIAKRLWGKSAVLPAVIVFSLLPLSLIGGIVTVPDSLLAVSWMAFLWHAHRFFTEERSGDLYAAAGALSMAVLTKYTAIFLALGSVALLLTNPRMRRWLIRTEFWVAVGMIIIAALPVFLWNAAYNWISFSYQLGNRAENSAFSLATFVQNVGAQIFMVSPVVWGGAIVVCIRWLTSRLTDPGLQFLGWFSVPLVVTFLGVGVVRPVLPHWPAVGYSVLALMMAGVWRGTKLFRAGVFMAGAVSIAGLLCVVLPVLPVPEALQNKDTPDKLYGWTVAGRELERLLRNHPGKWVVTNKPYTAGQLRFALARSRTWKEPLPEILCWYDRLSQYRFWNPHPDTLSGRDALAVIEGRYPESDEWIHNLPFENISEISRVSYRRSKRWPERQFIFYQCTRFNSLGILDETRKKMYITYGSFLENLRAFDTTLTLRINRNRWSDAPLYRRACWIVTNLGNGWVMAGIMLVALWWMDRGRYLYNVLFFLGVSLTGGALTQLLKFLFDTARPLRVTESIGMQLVVIGEELRNLGFPSGHTFLAFSAAVFLSARLRDPRATGALFATAAAVGFSRVLVGAHFVSDVVGGTLVGILYTAGCLWIESRISLRSATRERTTV